MKLRGEAEVPRNQVRGTAQFYSHNLIIVEIIDWNVIYYKILKSKEKYEFVDQTWVSREKRPGRTR